MTDGPTAYKVWYPQQVDHADGLASWGPGEPPPTVFVQGIAYIPADHPRAPYYLNGPQFAVEPVDEIPQDYKDAAAAFLRRGHHRLDAPGPNVEVAAPTAHFGRTVLP